MRGWIKGHFTKPTNWTAKCVIAYGDESIVDILELYISHAGQCKVYMREDVNFVKTDYDSR